MFAPPICRRSRRNASGAELISPTVRLVGFDEDGGSSANIAASGASNWTQRGVPSEAIKYVQSGTLSAVTVWLESSLISSVASLRGMSKATVPRTRSPAWSVPVCNMETPAPSTAVSNS